MLSRIAEEIADHPGNVWLPIISLRREDAARLGCDSAKQWQALLSAYAPQISEAIKIPWNQFRWYASYHDEGTHPHVHMVCCSADGRSGFLDEDGIAKIKSGLAKNIFRQELTEIYRQQTQRRDELVRKSGEVMEELIRQMRSGTLENPRIERLTSQLAERLKCAAGKKQYGYLSVSVKAVVNELAKDARVAAAYDLWYSLREEVLRTYRDDLPQRLPLSQQKEFKQIKNLVIEEAVRLGRHTEIFDPADGQEMTVGDTEPERPDDWPLHDTESDQDADTASVYAAQPVILGNPYAKYQKAKHILANPSAAPKKIEDAVMWLTQAAEAGLDDAQYALGRLYLDGGAVERDTTLAVIWFSRAAEQDNPYAQYFLDHAESSQSLFTCAIRLLHHRGIFFRSGPRRHPAGSRSWTASCGGRSGRRRSPWNTNPMTMRTRRLRLGRYESKKRDSPIRSCPLLSDAEIQLMIISVADESDGLVRHIRFWGPRKIADFVGRGGRNGADEVLAFGGNEV